jgi:hypothetical protein
MGRLQSGLDKRLDGRSWEKLGRSAIELYGVRRDWAEPLHAMLGLPADCAEIEAFATVWDEMASTVGVRGQGAGEHAKLSLSFDANKFLLGALWCATRHTQPQRVVETGVARGISSRVMLEALARNGNGHLWSIDLPHPANYQLGIAVTDRLRRNWSLRLGTSKVLLPELLDELGQIDLFMHDSLHTARNVEFELHLAWRHLRPGGMLFADDVHKSLGFHRFVQAENVQSWFVGARARRELMWGAAMKPPA